MFYVNCFDQKSLNFRALQFYMSHVFQIVNFQGLFLKAIIPSCHSASEKKEKAEVFYDTQIKVHIPYHDKN